MKSDRFLGNNGRAGLTILVIIIFLTGSCALANHPPVITNLKAEPGAILPSGSCYIEGIASDEDGDELSYEWLAGDGNIDGGGAIVTWTAPESEGIYNITVKVTDGNGGEVTDSITITVRNNRAPFISSLVADVDWLNPSDSCLIKCTAGDPDGDELNYKWSVDAGEISGTGPIVTWTAPDAAGLYNITVVVSDGYGGEDTASLTISVALSPPPTIEGLIVTPKGHEYLKEYDGGYKVGKAKSCDIECIVSDTSGKLVYEWACDDGEISGEGSMITWTAPDRAVEVTVTVTVSDAVGNIVSRSIVFEVVRCSPCTFR